MGFDLIVEKLISSGSINEKAQARHLGIFGISVSIFAKTAQRITSKLLVTLQVLAFFSQSFFTHREYLNKLFTDSE